MRIEATEFARAFCLCLCTFICLINCALDNVCCLMRDATSASETRDIIVRHNSRTQPEEKENTLTKGGKRVHGERGGSFPRSDAAQIRSNVAFVAGNGEFERRLSTARTKELARPKYNKKREHFQAHK